MLCKFKIKFWTLVISTLNVYKDILPNQSKSTKKESLKKWWKKGLLKRISKDKAWIYPITEQTFNEVLKRSWIKAECSVKKNFKLFLKTDCITWQAQPTPVNLECLPMPLNILNTNINNQDHLPTVRAFKHQISKLCNLGHRHMMIIICKTARAKAW